MEIKLKDNPNLILEHFVQLEYIQSTGTQYIDTEIMIKSSDRLKIVGAFTDLSQNNRPFASPVWSDTTRYFVFPEYSVYKYNWGYGNTTGYISLTPDTNFHTIDFNNNGKILIDGVEKVTLPSQEFTAPNLRIFGMVAGQDDRRTSCKIKSIEHYSSSGQLLHNFIPCKDKNDVVCLYDIVSDTFFYNKGRDCIAGPDVDNIDYVPSSLCLRTTSFYHKNTPKINGLYFLKNIINYQKFHQDEIILLNRIRVDIGAISAPLQDIMPFAGMAGFNDDYEPQTKPRLVGILTINNWYDIADYNTAFANFDGLTIVPAANMSYETLSATAIHLLSTSVPSVAPDFITSDIDTIYVGDGSSLSDDQTLKAAFAADSKWSALSSKLFEYYYFIHGGGTA